MNSIFASIILAVPRISPFINSEEVSRVIIMVIIVMLSVCPMNLIVPRKLEAVPN